MGNLAVLQETRSSSPKAYLKLRVEAGVAHPLGRNLIWPSTKSRYFMFDSGTAEDTRTREQLLRELEELNEILDESQKCTEKYFPEAAWNEVVHYPTLKLALKSFAGVEYLNVYDRRRSLILYLVQRLMLSSTTARVAPSPGSASRQRRYSPVENCRLYHQPSSQR